MSTVPQPEETRPASATIAGKATYELSPRRPIALLLSRFPLVTETFILREILELERQGQPVHLVPLLREDPPVMHREAQPWVEKALYTPFLSGPILLANLKVLGRRPATYWKLLRRMVLGPSLRFGVRVRTLALFPKSIFLAEQLQNEGIRHIHAHFATYPAAVAYIISSLTDITYSLTIHAHDIFVGQELLAEKIAAALWVRTISEYNRRYLLDRYPEILEEKLKVIHVGVDPPVNAAPQPTAEAATGPPTILSIAALKPYKGLDVLLEACATLHGQGIAFRCEIIGDGPLRDPLQQIIDRSGLSNVVRLQGARPQHEVARSILEASLIVLPSIVAPDGQMEGIPVALMEAMAAGRPVVASSLSGIPELIESGVDGVLTTPGDKEELASAIQSILADRTAAMAMGIRARKRVTEDFHLGTTVGELLSCLDESNPEVEIVIVARDGESDLVDPKPSRVGVRRIHRQRDSTVVELLLPADPQPREVIFKTHRSFVGQSRPARIRARDEFRWLGEIGRWLAREPSDRPRDDIRLTVPRPLDLFEDAASLTMERCQGRSLIQGLRRYRYTRWLRPPEEVPAQVGQAGRWLRALQGLEISTSGPSAGKRYLQETIQSTLRSLDDHLPPSQVSRYRHLLEELATRIDSERLRLVPRHGDFWPGNVFVERGLVQVIDFEGFGPGLAYEDLANFAAHLDLLFGYPLLRRRGQNLVQRLAEGFLADTELDPALYRFCRSVVLLKLSRQQPQSTLSEPLGAWRRHNLLTREPLA